MEEANVSGNGRETGGKNPFLNFGNGFKENNDAERGRRIVGELARFVNDHSICNLH